MINPSSQIHHVAFAKSLRPNTIRVTSAVPLSPPSATERTSDDKSEQDQHEQATTISTTTG